MVTFYSKNYETGHLNTLRIVLLDCLVPLNLSLV